MYCESKIDKLTINTGKCEQQSKPCKLSIPRIRPPFTSWIISGAISHKHSINREILFSIRA